MNRTRVLIKNLSLIGLIILSGMIPLAETRAQSFEVIDVFSGSVVEVEGLDDPDAVRAAYSITRKKIENDPFFKSLPEKTPLEQAAKTQAIDSAITEGVIYELAERICLNPNVNYCERNGIPTKCVGVSSFDFLINGEDRSKFSFAKFDFKKSNLKIIFTELICTDSEESRFSTEIIKNHKSNFINFINFGFNTQTLDQFLNSPLKICEKEIEIKKEEPVSPQVSGPVQPVSTGWGLWPFWSSSTPVEEKEEKIKESEDIAKNLGEVKEEMTETNDQENKVSSKPRTSTYYDYAVDLYGKAKFIAEGSLASAAKNVSKELFKDGIVKGMTNASLTNIGALALEGLTQHVMQKVAELTFMNDEAVNWPSILDALKADLLGESSEMTMEQKAVADKLLKLVANGLEEFKNNFDENLTTFLKKTDQHKEFNIAEAIKQAKQASLATFPPLSLIESTDEKLYQHIYALMVLKSLAGKTMPVSIKQVDELMKPDKFLGSISYFNGLKDFAHSIQKASIPHNYVFDKKVGLAISKAGTGKTYSLQHDVKKATGLKLLLIPGESIFNLKYPKGEAAFDFIVAYIVKLMRETFWYTELDEKGKLISVPARNGILVFDDLDSIFSNKGPFSESNPVARKRFLELIKNFGDIGVTQTFEINLLDGVEGKLKGKPLPPIKFPVDGRKISVAITFNEPPWELNPDFNEEIKKLSNEKESEFKARVQLINAIKSRIINLGVKYPNREDRMRVGQSSIKEVKSILTDGYPELISQALLEHPTVAKDFKLCEEKLEQMVDADMKIVNTKFNGEKGIRTFDVMLTAFQSRLFLTADYKKDKIKRIIELEIFRISKELIQNGTSENDPNFKTLVLSEVAKKIKSGEMELAENLMICANTQFKPQIYIDSSVEYAMGKKDEEDDSKDVEKYEKSVIKLEKRIENIGWKEKILLKEMIAELNKAENKGNMKFFNGIKVKFDEILLNRPQIPDGGEVADKILEDFKTIRTELPNDPFDDINQFVEDIYEGMENYYAEVKPKNYKNHDQYLVKYQARKNDELFKMANALGIPAIKIDQDDLEKNVPAYAYYLKAAEYRKLYLHKDKEKIGSSGNVPFQGKEQFVQSYERNEQFVYYSKDNLRYSDELNNPTDRSNYRSDNDVFFLYPSDEKNQALVKEGKFEFVKMKASDKRVHQLIDELLFPSEVQVIEELSQYLQKKLSPSNGLSKNSMFILESNTLFKAPEIKIFLKAMDELNEKEKANFLTMVIDNALRDNSEAIKKDLELGQMKILYIPEPQIPGRKVGAETWINKALKGGGKLSNYERMVIDLIYEMDFEMAVEYHKLFKEQLPSAPLLNGVGEIVGPNIIDPFWGEEAINDLHMAKEQMTKNLEKELEERKLSLEDKAKERAQEIFQDKWENSMERMRQKQEDLKRIEKERIEKELKAKAEAAKKREEMRKLQESLRSIRDNWW